MPHELFEREDMVKNTNYHQRKTIMSVFSVVKEILEFANIHGTSYTHNQAINTAYVIIHRTGKFSLSI